MQVEVEQQLHLVPHMEVVAPAEHQRLMVHLQVEVALVDLVFLHLLQVVRHLELVAVAVAVALPQVLAAQVDPGVEVQVALLQEAQVGMEQQILEVVEVVQVDMPHQVQQQVMVEAVW
jgi:hypothetical protein